MGPMNGGKAAPKENKAVARVSRELKDMINKLDFHGRACLDMWLGRQKSLARLVRNVNSAIGLSSMDRGELMNVLGKLMEDKV